MQSVEEYCPRDAADGISYAIKNGWTVVSMVSYIKYSQDGVSEGMKVLVVFEDPKQ